MMMVRLLTIGIAAAFGASMLFRQDEIVQYTAPPVALTAEKPAYCHDQVGMWERLFPSMNALYQERFYYEARLADASFIDRHLEGDASFIAGRAAALDIVTAFVHERLKECA